MTTIHSGPDTARGFAMPERDRHIIGTLLVGTFVVILNETIMGVALPRLMVDLEVNARTGQWLTTAFMLTMAVVIPTTGTGGTAAMDWSKASRGRVRLSPPLVSYSPRRRQG